MKKKSRMVQYIYRKRVKRSCVPRFSSSCFHHWIWTEQKGFWNFCDLARRFSITCKLVGNTVEKKTRHGKLQHLGSYSTDQHNLTLSFLFVMFKGFLIVKLLSGSKLRLKTKRLNHHDFLEHLFVYTFL